MATYLMLGNWTEQGLRNIKELPQRRRGGPALAQRCGCDLKAMSMTIGAYDLVLRVEAPDDEALARFALSMGARGNVRTTTLRVFSEEDAERVIGSLA